jgi:hypothetical protein
LKQNTRDSFSAQHFTCAQGEETEQQQMGSGPATEKIEHTDHSKIFTGPNRKAQGRLGGCNASGNGDVLAQKDPGAGVPLRGL